MSEEKPLDKCTVKELREIAMGIESIHGVSAMKKDELLRAIKEARGISEEKPGEKPVETIREVKQQIRALKKKKEELRNSADQIGVKRLKRKIGRLKKKTRNMARVAS